MTKIEVFCNYLIIILFTLFNGIFSQQYSIYYPTTNKDFLTKYYSLYNSKSYENRIARNSSIYNSTQAFYCTNPAIQCYGNGKCSKNLTSCDCDYGFKTIKGSFYMCGYPQKRVFYALCLETFISFGFGHLYIGRYSLFIGKFISFFFFYYLIFCIVIFIGSINESNVEEHTVLRTRKILFYLYPVILVWYIGDIVVFVLNMYADGNNQPLLGF